MPILETLVVGGTTVVAFSAASAAAYNQMNAIEPGEDRNTLDGLLKTLDATSDRIRRKNSGEKLGDYAAVEARRGARAASPKNIPIFSYGAVAGCAVLLPDAGACGDAGLEVSTVLPGSWAESCGARPGARLLAIDGTPLARKTAAEIRTIASTAARPLWLDVAVPKRSLPLPFLAAAGTKAGAHMML